MGSREILVFWGQAGRLWRYTGNDSPYNLFGQRLKFYMITRGTGFKRLFTGLACGFGGVFATCVTQGIRMRRVFGLSTLAKAKFSFYRIGARQVRSTRGTMRQSHGVEGQRAGASSIHVFKGMRLFKSSGGSYYILIVILGVVIGGLRTMFLAHFM